MCPVWIVETLKLGFVPISWLSCGIWRVGISILYCPRNGVSLFPNPQSKHYAFKHRQCSRSTCALKHAKKLLVDHNKHTDKIMMMTWLLNFLPLYVSSDFLWPFKKNPLYEGKLLSIDFALLHFTAEKNIRSYINFVPQDQRSWKNRILNSIWELLFLTPTSSPSCALKWGVGTLGVGTFHCKVQTPNTCNVFPPHLLQLVSTSAHPFLCFQFNFLQRETDLFA